MAYDKLTNPFYSPEEDTHSFGAPRYSQNSSASGGVRPSPFDHDSGPGSMSRYQQLQQMKENSLNNQLESTQRCLSSIYESEAMGISTAEELVRQGEQLDNVDQKLDKINQDMKTSQKHLNSIKSVFGSLKTWWKGDKPDDGKTDDKPKSTPSSSLTTALADSRQAEAAYDSHPAYRSSNTQGFYEDDDLDDKFLGAGTRRYDRPAATRAPGVEPRRSQTQTQTQTVRPAASSARDQEFHTNLDMMSSGMTRLKGLAQGLGSEIERQNEQLDKIMPKADKADLKLNDQNRQMRKILR